jgi:serine/threonine protein kinase
MPQDTSSAPDRVHWAMAVTFLTLRQPTLALPHLAFLNERSLSLDDLDRLARKLADLGALPEAIEIYRKILARDAGFRDVPDRLKAAEMNDRLVPGWLRKAVGERYSELSLVGAGGMGRVYRARDAKLGQHVAIKVPDEAAVAQEEGRNRFLREAEAMARLTHPHILRVHDVHAEEPLYYTMELVAGSSLAEILGDCAPIEPRWVLSILAQVASALEAIHGAGMVHRDLKPGNILVNAEDHVWLADFGLAYLDERTRLTRTGTSLGTPLYMPPEQLQGAEPDPAWDIYALGVVLFQALGSGPPFGPDQVFAKMVCDPPSLADKQPGLPAGVVEFVDSLIALDPGRRCRDVHVVHAALNRLESSWPPDATGSQEPVGIIRSLDSPHDCRRRNPDANGPSKRQDRVKS